MAYYGPIAISNAVGGLKENVIGDGMITCDPYNVPLFYNLAVRLIMRCESDPAYKEKLRLQQYNWSLQQTWDDRIPQWKKVFDIE